ncbi:cation diffusion facilitator family transporter containing protein [Trichomonas vaginalis G3]|uniref:Cation diffusion facilitator family transporter containing protein n=1 Tax=Trichomonas vaginalis (strain ATCC PRA-98 / G3) TaxID=412133 RepID=A2DBH6_TRIV3|nr:cation efflux family [Trichomonas vaginalis G3]EAY22179.1 cation diffusion facilitator family transporter containing protein [Trichomonas vaginalis G3]KAI5533363.1 cation efflux family [Trichomonas vaginalis G3]|eukprot:XP_001583165.1 cation diffusion facilitator family transporter containing protein [Trichomonas vaginalis G3]
MKYKQASSSSSSKNISMSTQAENKPGIIKKVFKFIDKWTRETSDIILVLLFSIQILFTDALTKYGTTAAIWLIYWIWRRDNWLVSIYNLIIFYFIGNDYFELTTRCFLFYCASNIAFYVNKNTIAVFYESLLMFVFVFYGNWGYRQIRDTAITYGVSLFFPLFFGDIQNDLLTVHVLAPYASAAVLLYYEDFVHVFPFLLNFLTSFREWPTEYPSFHNTKHSRNLIVVFAMIFVSFYYEYRQGVILESYNITFDSLYMVPILISLFVTYLALVFTNKEYSKQYRYGFSNTLNIFSLVDSIFLIVGIVLYTMDTIKKEWYLSSVGSDRNSFVLIIVIIILIISYFFIFEWRNLENIHKVISFHIEILILYHVVELISHFLALYLDFYWFEFFARMAAAIYSFYAAFPHLRNSISELLFNPADQYEKFYKIIDELCHVKHLDVRYGSGKWIVEAKCQLKERKMRVGVPSKVFHETFRKMGVDATIEIIDAPPKPQIVV